jgi:3-hydroxyacyl-[acyl-carrier-protein] dehydratase
VTLDLSPTVQELFAAACRGPLLERLGSGEAELERDAIQRLLPHRDPFLLLDRITRVDREARRIAGVYELERAAEVLAGHFPGYPVWPGVLQIEAIGQAGLCLARLLVEGDEAEGAGFALTHVLGARFLRPVLPGAPVEIAAYVEEDGLFTTVVGQTLSRGEVCSAAILRGLGD